MKSKNVVGKIVWKKSDIAIDSGRFPFFKELFFAVCVIFVLFIVYMLGRLYFTNSDVPESDASVNPAALFSDCTILREDCLNNIECNLLSLCGKGDYKLCRLYDCGDSYGIFTQDSEDKPEARREAKYDKGAVQEKKTACGKSLQITEQKCVDDKMQVMVKLNPQGDCRIGGFTLVYEGSAIPPNKFTELQGDNYLITAETCGKITGIIPRTEEGISIF